MTQPQTTLTAALPTPKAFAPFGTLLGRPAAEPLLTRGDITYWHATADLSALSGSGVTGFLTAHRRDNRLTQIERHNHTCEAFIPLAGRSLFVVGPPGELDLAQLRAFVLEPGAGILMHPGTWHWAPYPLTDTADFLLLLRRETAEHDVEMRDIAPHQIEPPHRIEPAMSP